MAVAGALASASPSPNGASPGETEAGAVVSPTSFPTPIQHVFLIMMENEGAKQVVGSGGVPYQSYLATTYAWGGDAEENGGVGYYAVCHPSTGDYIAVTAGQPLHCGSDGYATYSVNNLGNELQTAGLSWIDYEESATKNCQTTTVGLYAVRHNPFPYYTDLGSPTDPNSVCYTHVVPIGNLTQDYPYNATPPAFTYVVPNVNNDAHNTNAKVGDDFLRAFVSKLVNQTWFASTVIFIDYDESGSPQLDTGYDGLVGGPVPMFAVSPYSVGIGTVDRTNTSHYNLLATMEWLLGLPGTGTGNDSSAKFPAMKSLFNFGTVSSKDHTVSFTESGLPSGTNWSVTLDGSPESSSSSTISFSEPNGSYAYSVLSPTPADHGTRYVATPSSGSVDVSGANASVSVSYGPQYALAVTVAPLGTGTVSPENGWYASGKTVSIDATPTPGNSFSNWSGQGTGSYTGPSNPALLTVGGPITETAEFVPTSGPLVPVNFTETGLPLGTSWNVSLDGQWATSSNATVEFEVTNGSYGYAVESPVPGSNLSAQYVTAQTSGTVKVGNVSVGVSVPYLAEYLVNVSASPVGSGVVSPSSGWFAASSEVTLSAVAATGYDFAVWNGSGAGNYTGADPAPELPVDGPVAEVAEFVQPNVTPALLLVVTGLPPGTNWSLEVGGSNWTTNQTAITVPTSQGPVGYEVESPIPVASGEEYVALPSTGTVNLTGGPVHVTVSYVLEALLGSRVTGSGVVTMAPATNGWYPIGTRVVYTAEAPAGTVFAGWDGSGNGSYTGLANPVAINVSGPIVEGAHFLPTPPTAAGGATSGGSGSWASVASSILMVAGVLGTVVGMNMMVGVYRQARRRRKPA